MIFGAAVYDSIESDEEEHQKEALQGWRWWWLWFWWWLWWRWRWTTMITMIVDVDDENNDLDDLDDKHGDDDGNYHNWTPLLGKVQEVSVIRRIWLGVLLKTDSQSFLWLVAPDQFKRTSTDFPDKSDHFERESHLDPPANRQALLVRGLYFWIVNFGNSIGQLCPLSSHLCGHKIENKQKWSKSETKQKGWKVKVKKRHSPRVFYH